MAVLHVMYTCIVVRFCSFIVAVGFGLCQTQPARPAFEVASIRPSEPGTSPGLSLAEGGRLAVHGFTVKSLIQLAWHVRDVQVSGGPVWISNSGFDVVAKGDPAATDDQFRQMVQALLADRFLLVLHREMRVLPVYVLVLGKDAPKVRESSESSRPNVKTTKGLIDATKIRLTILAQLLSASLDRPVLDQTGLAGRYDFRLEWTPDDIQGELGVAAEAPVAPGAGGPSIFTAVQEQLGLRLQVDKGPVEVLVIDKVERPSAN